MKQMDGGVTSPQGFYAAAAAAQIKYKDRTDMAMVYSKTPAVSAGVFTTNVVKAAPVVWDQGLVESRETARAVVLNSGIANACTGRAGMETNKIMAQAAAGALNGVIQDKADAQDQVETEDILTASTGVIGMQLPADRIAAGAKLLAENLEDTKEAGDRAAEAIMTTDTMPKKTAVMVTLGGKEVTIGGMCKGSGMIHPNMATMLSVITTDARISKEMLTKAIKADVENSFNMVSVDRDTSTNDTYLILANGWAKNPEITEENEDYRLFCQALALVTTTLAKKMAADGEGATKLLEAQVIRCKTKKRAAVLAKSVIASNLVKTAVYGSDANWGRILCALGYSGEDFCQEKVTLSIQSEAGSLVLFEAGTATDYSEDAATKILSAKEVAVVADMQEGCEEATAWGCDLTYDYVKINGDYRS